MAEQPSVANIGSLFQRCRKKKNLEYAKRMHAQIFKSGSDAHAISGNYIVPMFMDCGGLIYAQQAFEGLLHRSEYPWTSLILGYIKCGQSHHAFSMYGKMKVDNVYPSTYTITTLLRACAREKDLEQGRRIHIEITNNGFEKDLFVGSTLVDMYAKCGSLTDAQEVFDKLAVRNTVCWTALIAGYVEHGSGDRALNYFKKMQLQGFRPDVITYVFALKACSIVVALEKGREMHSEIIQMGFEKDMFVATTLSHMYAKCCSLAEARETFNRMPVRNVVAWTTLLTAFAENESHQEVLNCLERMQLEGMFPDPMTYVCGLNACGNIGALSKGREMHAEIVLKQFETDVFVGNTLINMYAKCGSLSEAQMIFDKLALRNVVTWNALVAGYAENGFGWDALICFKKMRQEGVFPDPITFACSLKACAIVRDIAMCREIHVQIQQKRCETDPSIAHMLVDTYVKCGSLSEGRETFEKLRVRDIMSWNALISGYVENGLGGKALECLKDMQLEGISPNDVTFLSSLKACGSIGAIDIGRDLHVKLKQAACDKDLRIGSALVDMYAKCGSLAEAQEAFEALPARDVLAWTAMIAAYAKYGSGQEALNCFARMQLAGVTPDVVTFVCILQACGSLKDIDRGKELHTQIAKKGFENDPFITSSLIDMYVKCGSFIEAQEVLERLSNQNTVVWNTIIAGYTENALGFQALACFEQMQLQHVPPDSVTFVCTLRACGDIGAINQGRAIHKEILQGDFANDMFVGTALIDMYAKCGFLVEAREVYDKLEFRDIASCNAMIAGYGMNYEADMAIACFQQLEEEKLEPDAVTFTCLLTACSRSNLLVKGQGYFNAMRQKYGIMPTRDHLTCIIDLLARSGFLYGAKKALENIPRLTLEEALMAVISACKMYGETEIGVKCFQQLVQVNPENSASYVLMANIYADADR